MNTRGIKGLQDWPQPDDYALEQSRSLSGLILGEIDAHNGQIGFDRYMEMALASAPPPPRGSRGDLPTAHNGTAPLLGGA